MNLNRFQGRLGSGVLKGEPWPLVSSLYCPSLPAKPSFPISHRGLSNPQHLSHFTTRMVESWLVWRAGCSSVQDLETTSRHLEVLSSVIACFYSFNLFVCNLLQLITGVFAPSQQECLYGQNIYTNLKAVLLWSKIFFNYLCFFKSAPILGKHLLWQPLRSTDFWMKMTTFFQLVENRLQVNLNGLIALHCWLNKP